jgi:hypothetical protein
LHDRITIKNGQTGISLHADRHECSGRFRAECTLFELEPDSHCVGNRCGVFFRTKSEETMLSIPRPTPTCTRFQTTIEMPCMKCGEHMRLALIEPQDKSFDLLTYRCGACASDESFLKAT